MSKDLNIIDLLSDTIARRFPHRINASFADVEALRPEARPETDLPIENVDASERRTGRMPSFDVRDALRDGRVVVHYQPQYDLSSGRAVTAEALVRLVDTDANLVHPDKFIGQVEGRDVIVPLGRAVIDRVCADLARCRAANLCIRRIAVNLSAHQLAADGSLLNFIDRTIARYGLRHTDLEFELTERHSLPSGGAGHTVLSALAQRGSRIVIDDFGVGYSSVLYLAELPVAAFKLDRTLVERALNDSTARTLVEGLLALADNMGLDVIAEGVETEAQRDYLEAAGCALAQGYRYARPMPIDDLRQIIAQDNVTSSSCGMGA